MTDRESRVKVDISFNTDTGVESAKLIDVSSYSVCMRLVIAGYSSLFFTEISPKLSSAP